jgi:hypothetical protein
MRLETTGIIRHETSVGSLAPDSSAIDYYTNEKGLLKIELL